MHLKEREREKEREQRWRLFGSYLTLAACYIHKSLIVAVVTVSGMKQSRIWYNRGNITKCSRTVVHFIWPLFRFHHHHVICVLPLIILGFILTNCNTILLLQIISFYQTKHRRFYHSLFGCVFEERERNIYISNRKNLFKLQMGRGRKNWRSKEEEEEIRGCVLHITTTATDLCQPIPMCPFNFDPTTTDE